MDAIAFYDLFKTLFSYFNAKIFFGVISVFLILIRDLEKTTLGSL
jgi:hypothetical protein